MYLKSLEISGFKSFAKKIDLKFDTSISAIVGPNGSGKSNVAEAFRFVLGEQSIKSMRGKRGEDLIFNGTNTLARLNRASVKIIFDNSKKFLDIDYDEVSLERIVYRDGTNQYLINKSLVRLKDILELLAGANIGASGHHIISQGGADRILSVNAQDRRTMIEEALGLKIYQYKRIVSEKKLIKVAENMETTQSLMRENAPHLKFLKRQVEKIQKSLDLKKELTELYLEYFKREDTYLKYWNDKIEKDKKPLLAELIKLDQQLKESRELLSKGREEPDEKNQAVILLDKKLQELRKEKDILTFKLGQTEGTLSALKTFGPGVTQTEVGQRSFSWEEVKDLEVRVISQIEIAESLEDIFQIKTILKRIKQSFSQFIFDRPEELSSDKRPDGNSDKLKELAQTIKDLQEKIDLTQKQEEEFLSNYHHLQQAIEQGKNQNRDAELAVFEIMAKQSELNSQLNSFQNQADKIKVAGEEYKQELNEAYILAGRDFLQFHQRELKNETGQVISQSEILNEERGTQLERRKKIERIKIKVEDLGGGSGDDILKEYAEANKREEFLVNEINDLEQSAETLKNLIADLKEKIDKEFEEGLSKIDKQFKDFFVLMFGGGKASLKLVKEQKVKVIDENNLGPTDEDLIAEVEGAEKPQSEGIEVDVSLPNKKIKGLQMLSGGERSLTSIALLFAMSQVTPPPFLILDETDAALDEANSKKYGDMIETLSKSSQLILITHNRETMARANILYGVTMGGEGTSKLLSVQFDEAVKVAK